ncbi:MULTISPECIES: leucine efflux protein LeuE [Enterobacteriaceae]|uniref:Leucine efflux protein LeuE n=1 Tax=Kluyvera genomosp. 2 TaxID=2774054 RepID=A0A2T2XYT3_9ENTR|nr:MULTISPECIES: leucine efflux protein LeuE [Enterobacteriaceae]HAT3919510.1 leucine efflux protein LeuE [Kluyvera ascorbata]PSR45412.1 leucine efflux protein LeuE [Kluyvera genomosp. 2]BBQ84028.1 leucine efflux protein [Klebsiella sp. WP3-W18-ESBL-02]BBR20981.1 leucine efflux protein [Klebsiella sp. WP3-S18-ESBL-05]BBR58788.1 leucine efflux protein [Klebsiella sp. WP4-W18-ESBL-05]
MFADFGVLNYWTYLLGAIFIILVPGPNTLFVLKTGVAHGIRKGYMAALAVFIGDAVLMFLSFAGVATLIKTTPLLFNIVRYLGAFYLLYLGGKMLYSTLKRKAAGQDAHAEPGHAIFKRALTLSLTNPKAILFYVSFFVQFIDVHAATPGLAFFILALTLELVSFTYLSFLIVSGSLVTRYVKTRKKLAKIGNSLIGLVFVGFAARLATLQS